MADAELTFEPFDAAALATWLVELRSSYIEERVLGGDSQPEAEVNADESLARLLPAGVPSPGQLIGRVLSDGEPIGYLWIGPYGDDPQRWWVWDVAVDQGQRGRGYGRRAMLLAEKLARQAGAATIGLNVFRSNALAHHLYASLGYQETSVQMRKDL
jgi:ribosomal protein S18 acetylase RimI-like enzyme